MKKKNRLLRFAFVLAFLVSFGFGNELWATHYWRTVGTDTDWNNLANWSTGAAADALGTNNAAALPTAIDDVTFTNGSNFQPALTASSVAKSITLLVLVLH